MNNGLKKKSRMSLEMSENENTVYETIQVVQRLFSIIMKLN